MQQYLDLLKAIQEKGTYKPPARPGMPGTQSLFGYQFRHNLADGFPLLTTKEMYWKGVVIELLWFLRGDTNIKYLVDNGVNIWNEDAYNYYEKRCIGWNIERQYTYSFDDFIKKIRNGDTHKIGGNSSNYYLGDCGYQYGKVWRHWDKEEGERPYDISIGEIDQIKNLINSLKNTPESRRHIVTAIDPAHDTDLALYWCHAMFQFNCRPLSVKERAIKGNEMGYGFAWEYSSRKHIEDTIKLLDAYDIPKYYLDCQLYQRSADVVLGVPFNIASYALLMHIIAKICNMLPGEFIHTFGDVHIYDNHKEAVKIQLQRVPGNLPTLEISKHKWDLISKSYDFTGLEFSDFIIKDYNPQSKIKAKLSTGLK